MYALDGFCVHVCEFSLYSAPALAHTPCFANAHSIAWGSSHIYFLFSRNWLFLIGGTLPKGGKIR